MDKKEALFISLLRQVWGDKIADCYERGEITIEQIEQLENGFWITTTKGERFNGLEHYV